MVKTVANPEAAWPFPVTGSPSYEAMKKTEGSNAITAVRNPPWSRDELILALDLYLRHRASPLAKESADVKSLSALLNAAGKALGIVDKTTFRNVNGVYMKMMNFRRFDPEYTNSGKVGLTAGNKDEQVVWNRYAHDPAHLSAVVAAITAAIHLGAATGVLAGQDGANVAEAEEGRLLTRLHRYRERNRGLIDKCKVAALKKHGRLFCEACGFDFSKRYGAAGEGLIDIHHTKPVHTLTDGDKTSISDLVLLCSNCHRVVHASKRWLTIDELRLTLKP